MRNPVSRFAYTQSDLGMRRSKFDRTHDHKTTMSAGLLYPILVDEVLPGDTYSVDMSSLVRMSTPIHPVMDNAFLDVYFFYSKNIDVWDHWKEFMGESPVDPYVNPIEYRVPALVGNEISQVPPKSLLDYMGVPSYSNPMEINALPIRHFCHIWNNWFRDQNLQSAINFSTDDRNVDYAYIRSDSEQVFRWDQNNRTNPDAYVTNTAHGGDLPPVNKYHDYFTSALREPQKGEPVPIPLSGFAPVYANDAVDLRPWLDDRGGPIKMVTDSGDDIFTGNLVVENGVLGANPAAVTADSNIYPTNLGADLNDIAGVYATISDLRYAFQLQKFLEADARGGTRYKEILKQHFDVTAPDLNLGIPEFLGGKRIPINISQIFQTSATDDVSPQGNAAAYSLTTDKMSAFTKSFSQHGFIIGVACIRTEHTYTQGLECMWSRFNKFDYYFPEFANISDQPIYNRELYIGWGTHDDVRYDGIFGYKEPWSEYKFKPNRVSGEFRPDYPQSLDIWHYGDDYQSQPYLSSEWIRETRANIDRTLAVSSDVSDQFICDFYFKLGTTRVMPVYSIPGLADHH